MEMDECQVRAPSLWLMRLFAALRLMRRRHVNTRHKSLPRKVTAASDTERLAGCQICAHFHMLTLNLQMDFEAQQLQCYLVVVM